MVQAGFLLLMNRIWKNDVENHVQLVIDEDVLKGEYVGCHPCINTSSLRVRTADLMEKIIPAMHHEAKIIQI